MLRLLVVLLVLANGAYYAWSQDLRLLSTDEARALPAGAASLHGAECLQAGLFDARQAEVLRQALATALPEGSWRLEAGEETGRWIVYMGRYPTPEALVKKRVELRARNVRFEALANPALEPGLSLGGFPSETEANAALAALASKGVRTARVLQERPDARGEWLLLPAADAALRARAEALRTALSGKTLRPCR
jgi:hypothetical protein